MAEHHLTHFLKKEAILTSQCTIIKDEALQWCDFWCVAGPGPLSLFTRGLRLCTRRLSADGRVGLFWPWAECFCCCQASFQRKISKLIDSLRGDLQYAVINGFNLFFLKYLSKPLF